MNADQKNRRLRSLCALSAAAVAATAARQSEAAVVVTNVGTTIGFGAKAMPESDQPLAGGDGLVILTSTNAATRSVRLLGTFSASLHVKAQVFGTLGFARPLPAGVKFANAPAGTNAGAPLEMVSSKGAARGPGAFSNLYYSFSFNNKGTTDYGWIQGSLTDTTYNGLDYTFTRYAYDNTGAQLATGATSQAVPEPGTGGLALAGLLVGGAAGVRRQKRAKTAVAAD